MNDYTERKYTKMWYIHCQIMQEIKQDKSLLVNSNIIIGLI